MCATPFLEQGLDQESLLVECDGLTTRYSRCFEGEWIEARENQGNQENQGKQRNQVTE